MEQDEVYEKLAQGKDEILKQLNKGKDKFAQKFIDNQDENGVLKENIGFDNILKRDPTRYMRLRGTEKSFFQANVVNKYIKEPNGEYRYESGGTLVLTTRRLTYSTLSGRGRRLNDVKIGFSRGFAMSHYDFIIFSYPTISLLDNSILDCKGENMIKVPIGTNIGRRVKKELILEKENIKFEILIYIEDDIEKQRKKRKDNIQIFQVDLINNLLSMKLEHFMTYMKYFYGDSELFQNWSYPHDENNKPYDYDFLSRDDRNKLLTKLLNEHSKYSYTKPSPNWFGVTPEEWKIKENKDRPINYLTPKEINIAETQEKVPTISKESKETSSGIEKDRIIQENTIKNKLLELKDLYDNDLVSEEEYKALKKKLLGL